MNQNDTRQRVFRLFGAGIVALIMAIAGWWLLPAGAVSADEIILDEPFDDAAQFSTSESFFSDGDGDYFGLPDGSGGGDFGGGSAPSGLKAYTGFTGSFLAGMDLDGEGASLPITVTWSGLDVTGLVGLQFSGDFAEYFDSPGDIDPDDLLRIDYQLDSGGWSPLLQFSGADFSTSVNGIFREDTDFDGTGDGTALGNAAQRFTKAITETGTTLDLRLVVSLNSGDEDFGADNFQVTGLNVVLVEPFDGATQFITSTQFFSDGGWDYFGLPDGGGGGDFGGDTAPSGLKAYTGFTDSFLAGMDLDEEGSTIPVTLTWTSLDITGLTDLQFSGDFAEYFDDPGDIDAPDYLLVAYQVDGGGYETLLQFSGADFSSGSFNGIFREDTDFDGIGDGRALGNAAQTFTKTFSVSGSALDLRFSASLDSGDEDFGADNFSVTEARIEQVPDIQIGKDVTPAFVLDGETVTYTVTLANQGTLTDVVLLTDTLPAEVEFASWIQQSGAIRSGNAITWTGALTAGHTISLTFTATNTTAITGPVTNTVYFSGTQATGSAEAVFEVLTISRIHEIQGSGASSPEVGNVHTVEGIVIGDFQTGSEIGGFFLQEENADVDGDPVTSEGLYVYSWDAVDVGDKVRVRGEVEEYFGLTELTNVTDVRVLASGQPLPTAAEITLPFSSTTYLERYEGMAVKVMQPLHVTENYNLGRGGLLELSSGGRLMQPTQVVTPGASAVAYGNQNDLNRLILDDRSTDQNPDPIIYPSPYLSATNSIRSGDVVSDLVGVLTYSWSGWSGTDAYRIHPTTYPTIMHQNPRPTEEPAVGGGLQVASLNVYNYFDTFSGCTAGVGGVTVNCRGADNAIELTRQHDKIVNAILEMDADVIGLQEIENDGYADEASAIDFLVDGINAIAGTGTYTYVNADTLTGETNALGTDAIKVGLLYQPDRVVLTGTTRVIDDDVDPAFHDDYNRPALVQSFASQVGNEVFTVIVNHLKSKGSDCDAIGDPDEGDGQGNCNLTRTSAVTVTLNYLATDPTGVNDTDFLIIGDLNAYAMEDPIQALEDAGYVNLVKEPYTYAFFGEWGVLDHAFASPSMAAIVTGAAPWHINADEPNVLNYNTNYISEDQVEYLYSDAFYRASDHDPVIVGMQLPAAITVTKAVTPTTATFREVVTYTLTLANTGGVSETVTLTDTLPAEVQFARWVTQPMDAVLDQQTIRWTGTLTAGHTLTTTFAVTNTAVQQTVENTVAFAGTTQAGSAVVTFEATGHRLWMPIVMRSATP